jgi:hypothetical protein
LAAVFGEEPPLAPQPAPAAAPAAGFSFDEFFGGKRPSGQTALTNTPPAETEAAPPDDFVSWLKGLKS